MPRRRKVRLVDLVDEAIRSHDKDHVLLTIEESINKQDFIEKMLGVEIKRMNGAYSRAGKKIEDHFGIDRKWYRSGKYRKSRLYRPAVEYLKKNGDFITTHGLKTKLLREDIKQHRCEVCNLSEWNGRPIPIELDHINGDRNDNQLHNLRIICPNCHAQTDTYKSKNIVKVEI